MLWVAQQASVKHMANENRQHYVNLFRGVLNFGFEGSANLVLSANVMTSGDQQALMQTQQIVLQCLGLMTYGIMIEFEGDAVNQIA